MNPDTLTGTIPAPARLDKALADATGLSRERIKALISEGQVTIDGKTATSPSAKAQAGAGYTVNLPPPEDAQAYPQDIPLTVV